MSSLPQKAEKKQRPRLRLDAASRALLHRFMMDWVWPRRLELVWTLFLTVCLAGVTGSYPAIIKKSFDLLMGGHKGALPWVLAAIVGITLARATLLFLQAVASSRVVLRLTSDMQKVAFRHLINSDFSRLSRETPGRLMSRLTNDIGFIQVALTAGLNSFLRDLFSVIALVVAMLYLDWAMTLIVLGVYPLAAIPVATISDRLRRVAKRTQSGLGDMTSLLSEKLSGARLIKSFRLEDYAAARLDNSFEELYGLKMKSVRTRARMDPILEALGGLAVAGVVGFAYLRISHGISTVGDFMGFITALLMAAQPIRALGNLAGRVQEGIAAAESFYGLIDEKPAITDKPGAKELQDFRRGHFLPQRRVQLRQALERARRLQLYARSAGWQHRCARRPLGWRQVNRRQSGAAAFRYDRRSDFHRRAKCAGRDARVSARPSGNRQSGHHALRRYDCRQHRPRASWRQRKRHHRGREGRSGPRLHSWPNRKAIGR